MTVKQFLLFTSSNEKERKQFVASFDSGENAIGVAEKIKLTNSTMRWQVIDSRSGKIVAEDPGSEP
jgi:hypothetical protein